MPRERERERAKPNDYSVYDCKFIETAKKKKDLICNPIYKWTDADVWDFIKGRDMKYNPLYDKGYVRVGCIGCPLASSEQIRELNEYPKYKHNYIMAFQKMVEARKANGKDKDSKYSKVWRDGASVYMWWVEDENIPGQLTLDGTEYKG